MNCVVDIKSGEFRFLSSELNGSFGVFYDFNLSNPDQIEYEIFAKMAGEFSPQEYRALDFEIENMIPIKIDLIIDELREELIYYSDNAQNLNFEHCFNYTKTIK